MWICHYCRFYPGRTIDHIVPRALLPKEYPNALPMGFHQRNRVYACEPCNTTKGHRRAECVCERCRRAWRLARQYLEPLDRWFEPSTISIEDIINGRAHSSNVTLESTYPYVPRDEELDRD